MQTQHTGNRNLFCVSGEFTAYEIGSVLV